MKFIHIADVHLGMKPDISYRWSSARASELYETFNPVKIQSKEELSAECERTVKLVMERDERDNITVIALAIKEIA